MDLSKVVIFSMATSIIMLGLNGRYCFLTNTELPKFMIVSLASGVFLENLRMLIHD